MNKEASQVKPDLSIRPKISFFRIRPDLPRQTHLARTGRPASIPNIELASHWPGCYARMTADLFGMQEAGLLQKWDFISVNNQYRQIDMPHLSWFLVHCKPNAAQLASQNLRNQNFGVFLPMQKITKRKAKQFKTTLRPLFPGYLFVQIDPLAGDWRKINNTRGVARLVQLGADPCPVPHTVIAALLERCDEGHVLQDPGTLEVGNQARIFKGPLSGLIAEIINIEPLGRVHLLLDIMGQATNVFVAPSTIISIK